MQWFQSHQKHHAILLDHYQLMENAQMCSLPSYFDIDPSAPSFFDLDNVHLKQVYKVRIKPVIKTS